MTGWRPESARAKRCAGPPSVGSSAGTSAIAAVLRRACAAPPGSSRRAIRDSERGLGHGAAFTRQPTEGNRSLQRCRSSSSSSSRCSPARSSSPCREGFPPRTSPRRAAIDAAAMAVEESVERHRRLRRFVAARLDPAVATGLALTIALVVAVAGGFVLAVLAYLVRGNQQLRSIDNGAADWGHAHADRALDPWPQRRHEPRQPGRRHRARRRVGRGRVDPGAEPLDRPVPRRADARGTRR